MASIKLVLFVSTLLQSLSWECGGANDHIFQGPFHQRNLISRSSSLSPLRLNYNYNSINFASSSENNNFRTVVMPAVRDFYSTRLSVYSVLGNLIIPSNTCGNISVPLSDQTTGIPNTDIAVYMVSINDSSSSIVASGGSCLLDSSASQNVIAGSIVINLYSFSSGTFSSQFSTLVHETLHLLGFSQTLFSYWKDSTGSPYSSPTKTIIVRGLNKTVLATPNVVAKAISAFGCSSLVGVELEDSGGAGTAGSHWEMRVMFNDFMIGKNALNPIFSTISLAAMEDSGWYKVNYTRADIPMFGKGLGCSFLNNACLTSGVSNFPSLFCDRVDSNTCDSFALYKSSCKLSNYTANLPLAQQYFSIPTQGGDSFADYCPIFFGYGNGNCRATSPSLTLTDSSANEVIGPISRCFVSTLSTTFTYSTNKTRCYQVVACNSTAALVQIGSRNLSCPFTGGTFTVQGYLGNITCPASDILCAGFPCIDGCRGYGVCINGVCNCDTGYSGPSCEFKCDSTCSVCNNTNCLKCYDQNAVTSGLVCVCNNGYTNSSGTCVACGLLCVTCSSPTFCNNCIPGASATNGVCSCSSGFYLSGGSCLACPNRCSKCTSSSVCVECVSNYDASTLCTTCINHYDINSFCTTCLNKFDVSSACTKCLDYYSISSSCTSCLDNYNISNYCVSCINFYDPDSLCTKCMAGIDISSACTSCLNPAYSATEPRFLVSFSSPPSSSSDTFTITIYSFKCENSTFGNVPFSLNFLQNSTGNNYKNSGLVLSNSITGNLITNSTGFYVTPAVQILSAGYFNFVVQYKSSTSATLSTGFIKNSVKYIEANVLTTVYLNYPTYIGYTIYGDDSNPYIFPASASLTEGNNKQINGNTISNQSAGSFIIYFLKNDMYNLSISTNVSSFKSYFQVFASKLNLAVVSSFDNTTVSNNSSPIKFNITVYGNTSSQAETYNGNYSLLLTANSVNSANSYSSVLQTTKGAGFLSIQIPIPGTYRFQIASTDQISSSYARSLTVLETLQSIKFNSSVLNNYANTLINLTLQTIGYSGMVYSNQTILSISCGINSYSLNPLISTTSGTATSNLYFTGLGQYSCVVGALEYEISQLVLFNINKPKQNPDGNCSVDLSPTICYLCANNSQLNSSGSCKCVQNSFYNSSSSACECNFGFSSVNNYCVTCGYFFKSSEISATFSQDYSKILVSFQSTANINYPQNDLQWQTAFPLTDFLRPFFKSAQWVSPMSCVINLNQSINSDRFNLTIDPYLVQKVPVGNCGQDIETLTVLVFAPPKPTPVVSLFAPQQVSLVCGNNFINIYTTAVGNYAYLWTSSNPAVSLLLLNQDSYFIQIDISNIFQSFDVTLTVKDLVFLTNSSALAKVALQNSKALTVAIDQGSVLSYPAAASLQLKAMIPEPCGESVFSYMWSLSVNGVSNNTLLSSILTAVPQLLLIKALTFTPENKYLVSVFVNSSNGINGLSYISINSLSSDLVVNFDQSSGNVSSQNDLIVNANVTDPDDPSFTNFSFFWNCTNNGKVCLGSDGNYIQGSITKTLNISRFKLISGSEYIFIFNVSRNLPFKSATKSIFFIVSNDTTGQIIMPTLPSYQVRSKSLTITPQLILNGTKSVSWSLSPNVTGLNLTDQYLYIPAYKLTIGVNYIVTVSLKLEGAPDYTAVSAIGNFYVNAPPRCSNFTAVNNSNGDVVFTAIKCADVDSNSPILYQFGTANNGVYQQLTVLISTYTYTIKVLSGYNATVTVCDNLTVCTMYINRITQGRVLKIDSQAFKNELYDIDQLPALVVYYSSEVNDELDFLYLYEQIYSYYLSVILNPFSFSNFVNTIINLVVPSEHPTALTKATSHNVTSFIISLILKYNRRLDPIEYSSFFLIISSLAASFSPRELKSYLDTIGEYSLLGAVFDFSILNKNLNYLRQRVDSRHINGELFITGNNSLVVFPNDLQIKHGNASIFNMIYDISFYKYESNGSIFELDLTVTGNQTNGVALFNPGSEINVSLSSQSGIQVSLTGNYNPYLIYECVCLNENNLWTAGKCKINSVTSDLANLTVSDLSIFYLRETNSSCKIGSGPITAMSVLFIISFFAVFLASADKITLEFSQAPVFFLLFPLSSLFIRQPMRRRATILIQMVSSELLLLVLIGAVHYFMDNIYSPIDASFDRYFPENFTRGAIGFAFNQVFVVPVFVANAFMLEDYKYHYTTVPVCLVVIMCCVSGVVVMTVFFCAGWTFYWIISWLIFLGCDVFILSPLYCLLVIDIFKFKTKEFSNLDRVPYRETKPSPRVRKVNRMKVHAEIPPEDSPDIIYVPHNTMKEHV